ncbi:MAG: sulfatase [Candidatus Hermodarchaeota archaeon]
MKKPNKIIFIVIDTLRADHLGCYGYSRNTSTNIDNLASESLLFKNCFSPASHTIPSIGSTFTAKYPSNHSIGFNQNVFVETGKLDTNLDITTAEIMSHNQYKTAAFVSGIVLRKETNFNVGFKIYDDEIGMNQYGRRNCSKTNQRVFKWLAQNCFDDFFLFIHYFDVHGPYITRRPYQNIFVNDEFYGYPLYIQETSGHNPTFNSIPHYQLLNKKRDNKGNMIDFEKDKKYYISQYDACIKFVDDNLGNLLQKTKELNIYDDAIIIITSDHGEAFGENNIYFYHGLSVTLEQIAVPLIIKPHKSWKTKKGVITTQVSTIDIMPTLLTLCNYDYSDLGIDGHSLKNIVENKEDPLLKERILVSENERQYALIYPDHLMELKKKDSPSSTYYPNIPELIDVLNGKKFYWDSGERYVFNLPFDQYQRYKIVADIIDKFRIDKKVFKILEVGASFEGNLKLFLPNDDIYFLDKEYPPEYEQRDNFIISDIIKLDVDSTYDLVVSIDTYEHIFPISRQLFIKNLLRLSKIATIIAAPFNTSGVKKYEVLANALYRLSHGKDHNWLHEHINNGLPSLTFTTELIKKFGFDYSVLPNGYLPRWFEMISICFLTEGISEFSSIREVLFEFYNKNFYQIDNIAPAYRQVIVINKKAHNPDFSDILTTDFNSKDIKFKYEYLKSIREKIYESSFYQRLSELNASLQNRDRKIQQKEEQIKAIYSSRTWKAGRLVTAPWRLGKKLLMKKS